MLKYYPQLRRPAVSAVLYRPACADANNMRRSMRRSTAQATLPIGAYVNDLYAVDKTLIAMIHKRRMEILRVTKLGSATTARRRIPETAQGFDEERRDMILARILQLENLHINNLQIDAFAVLQRLFRAQSIRSVT